MKKLLILTFSVLLASSCGNSGGDAKQQLEDKIASGNAFVIEDDETICDSVKGKKSLYGLCNAYCNGTKGPDVIEFDEDGDISHITGSKLRGSLEILQQYNKKRKEDDPKMPCRVYETQCPVFTQAEVDRLGTNYENQPNHTGFILNYQNYLAQNSGRYLRFSYGYLGDYYNNIGRDDYSGTATVLIEYNETTGEWIYDRYKAWIRIAGTTIPEETHIFRSMYITLEEAQSCLKLVRSRQAELPLGYSTFINGVNYNVFPWWGVCTSNCPDLID